jgi:hypothetical protein
VRQIIDFQNNASLSQKQRDFLDNITVDDLQQLSDEQIKEILDQSGIQVPFMSKVMDRTNKKMFKFNYHMNSEEFKDLGNLHRERRILDFLPQDEKIDFSSKP